MDVSIFGIATAATIDSIIQADRVLLSTAWAPFSCRNPLV